MGGEPPVIRQRDPCRHKEIFGVQLEVRGVAGGERCSWGRGVQLGVKSAAGGEECSIAHCYAVQLIQ